MLTPLVSLALALRLLAGPADVGPNFSSAEAAQDTAASGRQGALKVFLDCDWCDEQYLRTEVTFIDYMRDRKDADVHVLVTTQGTGGGGTEYTLKFIGAGRFAGVEQTLKDVVPQASTEDERRRVVVEVFKRGLVRYVAETPMASRLKITFAAPAAGEAAGDPKKDPWNLWVFRTSLGGSISGERSNKGESIRGSFSANRTTHDWKLGFSASGSYRENTYELSETETYKSVSRSMDGSARVVKSLSERWSAAVLGSYSLSTFYNYDMRTRLAGGVEYDVFPYSQSTRRLFTVQYTIGHNAFDYHQETIFEKMSEQLMDHRLTTSLSMRQPWGSAYADVSFSQYLNKPDKYNVGAYSDVVVRLFKGFSFNVWGSVARTRDQIFLPRAGATAEEILVRQRQLATGYRYSMNFNISYSFGSITNNVVNPRFGGGEVYFF
jgi:hypothetical protein